LTAPESLVNNAHRGSFFYERWELRVTERCLVEDLEVAAGTPFEDLLSHEIIKAFTKDRASTPEGGKTVGPAAGDKTLYRLGYGDDHRGATWHDALENVVWLCAYHGRHRSGHPQDAFPYFDELIKQGRIRPTEDDYTRLFEERDERFVDLVLHDAQALLKKAQSEPGKEVSGVIGGEATVGVFVEVVETLSETYIAFSAVELGYERLAPLLAAFFPEDVSADWEQTREFPTRELRKDELCFRILH
jgi:hypothetical protein